jgi:hypothetical protein
MAGEMERRLTNNKCMFIGEYQHTIDEKGTPTTAAPKAMSGEVGNR